MKLHEAFFLSLITSLFAGAFLFLAIPLTGYCAVSDTQGDFIDSEMAFILVLLYGIYAVIQLILSIINLLQVVHLRSTLGSNFDKSYLIPNFLIAELSLYFIVFVVMISLIGLPVFVLLLSIPYVICCTVSIYIFRYFLSMELVSGGIHT